MFAHPSAFVSTFHFFNLLFKIEQRLQGLRPLYWSKLLSLSIFTFICHGCNASIKTRPLVLAERVPEFKQFCHLSPLLGNRSNRSLGPARRSSCLPEDALPHAWVGSPDAGRVAPLVGRLFPPHKGRHPSPHLGDLTHT